MSARIPNPFVVGRDGMEARLPARVCRILEAELGRELGDLRTRARGVDPEFAYALLGLREVALSFVPPEEQQGDASQEQPRVSEWLSTTEAADLLRVKSSRAVVQAIARGTLKAERVGRNWRVRREDVEEYRRTRAA